jgi:GNAT superfamily N-acetyltransferase
VPTASFVLLADLAATTLASAGYSFREIITSSELIEWLSSSAAYFDEPEAAAPLAKLEPSICGLTRSRGYHRYAAWHGGRIVATASVMIRCGAAGLFCVATAPEHRRRGVATALLRVSVNSSTRDTSGGGAAVPVTYLTTDSEATAAIYTRMGFAELFRYTRYSTTGAASLG